MHKFDGKEAGTSNASQNISVATTKVPSCSYTSRTHDDGGVDAAGPDDGTTAGRLADDRGVDEVVDAGPAPGGGAIHLSGDREKSSWRR